MLDKWWKEKPGLSLKCAYIQSESSQGYESTAWQADSSKALSSNQNSKTKMNKSEHKILRQLKTGKHVFPK